MTDTSLESILSGRAMELRRAFDSSFAAPVLTDLAETIDFIAIDLGGDPYAIRMTEIAGLFADMKVTPCPSPIPELRGIAGFRGSLTPVYDLAALLGCPASSPRWLILARGGVLAIAFDTFNRHFRAEPAMIAHQEATENAQYVHEIVRQSDAARPVIDIPSIVAAIKKRLPQTAASKE